MMYRCGIPFKMFRARLVPKAKKQIQILFDYFIRPLKYRFFIFPWKTDKIEHQH